MVEGAVRNPVHSFSKLKIVAMSLQLSEAAGDVEGSNPRVGIVMGRLQPPAAGDLPAQSVKLFIAFGDVALCHRVEHGKSHSHGLNL